jgi:hypothetical protein
MDRRICERLRNENPGRYEHRGYQDRQQYTSMGLVKLRFYKLRDWQSGSYSCPGKKVLDCPAYIRWPKELLVNAAGLLPFMSYSHSVEEVVEQQGFGPSKTTLHGRLQDLVGIGEYRPYLQKRQFRYLMVDGTGAKFQDRSANKFYSGEVRFAYASTGEGRPFELVGIWVNKDWKACASRSLLTDVH